MVLLSMSSSNSGILSKSPSPAVTDSSCVSLGCPISSEVLELRELLELLEPIGINSWNATSLLGCIQRTWQVSVFISELVSGTSKSSGFNVSGGPLMILLVYLGTVLYRNQPCPPSLPVMSTLFVVDRFSIARANIPNQFSIPN